DPQYTTAVKSCSAMIIRAASASISRSSREIDPPVPAVAFELVHKIARQRAAVTRPQIALDVPQFPHARNHRADRLLLKNEAQRELRQSHAGGGFRIERLHALQRLAQVGRLRVATPEVALGT